jgi:hypothetical protein
MAKIFKTDGSILETEPKNGTHFTLEELKEIVGGWIEIVYLPNKEMMIIDEEGKLKGKPYNLLATSYWKNHNDFIVGDVLLCKSSQVL